MLARRCSSFFPRTINSVPGGELWIALGDRLSRRWDSDITDEQIAEMEAHKDDINYEVAQAREKRSAATM